MLKRTARAIQRFWRKIFRQDKNPQIKSSIAITNLDRAQAMWNARSGQSGDIPVELKKMIKPDSTRADVERIIQHFLERKKR